MSLLCSQSKDTVKILILEHLRVGAPKKGVKSDLFYFETHNRPQARYGVFFVDHAFLRARPVS